MTATATATPTRPAVRLRLPGTPPSINAIDGWREQPEASTPWRELILAALRDQGAPYEPGTFAARVHLHWSDDRRRNPENFAQVISRAIRDALLAEQWIARRDDLAVEVTIGPRRKSPATRILIEEVPA